MGKKDKKEAEPPVEEAELKSPAEADEPLESMDFSEPEKAFTPSAPSDLPRWVLPVAVAGLITISALIIYIQLTGHGVF